MFKLGTLQNMWRGLNDRFDNQDGSGGTFKELTNLKPNKKLSSLKSRGPFKSLGLPSLAVKNGLVPGLSIYEVKEAFQFKVTKPSEKLITEIAAVCKMSIGSSFYYMLRFFRYPAWYSCGYLSFDGSTTFLNGTSFNISTVHSIEATVLNVTISNNCYIIGDPFTGTNPSSLRITATIIEYSCEGATVSVTHGITDWTSEHTVFAVRDDSDVTFYVDGVKKGDTQVLGGNSDYLIDRIGKHDTEMFDGDIRHVRVYNFAFNDQQVSDQCSVIKNPFKVPFDISTLLARYEFDGSGMNENLEMDQSGNDHTMTQNGTISYVKNMKWVNGWQEKKVWYIDLVKKSVSIDAIGLASEPSEHVSSLALSNPTQDGFDVSWVTGGGAVAATAFTVFRTIGSNVPDSPPNDSEVYTAGTNVGNAYVAYVGASTSFTDSSADEDTDYTYTVYPSNGAGSDRNYKKTLPVTSVSGSTLSLEPLAQPTQAPGSPSFNPTANELIFTVIPNSASDRFLILAKTGSSPTSTPSDSVDYAIGYTFGDGSSVVFNGTGVVNGSYKDLKITVSVSGPLLPATTYYFDIFAYREDS